MTQMEMPPAQDGQHMGFSVACPSCKAVGAFMFVRLLLVDKVKMHRYGCPDMKCAGKIDVAQNSRRRNS